MTQFPIWMIGSLCITLLLGLSGCSSLPDALPAITLPEPLPTEEPEPLVIPTDPPPPSVAVLLIDSSASRHDHRVQPPNLETLAPLFEEPIASGGAIAVGTVCDDSNQPLTRLTVSQSPPVPKDLHIPKYPEPIDETSINPLRLPEKQQQFEAELAAYFDHRADVEQVLATYQKDLAAHEAAARTEVQEFSTAITPLLERPADCQHTDLWGALKRADLMLSEDPSVWSEPPEKYLLIISDGIHDTQTQVKPAETLTSTPEILLVNGSGSTGIFAEFDHKAFESTDAAIAHLISLRSKAQ